MRKDMKNGKKKKKKKEMEKWRNGKVLRWIHWETIGGVRVAPSLGPLRHCLLGAWAAAGQFINLGQRPINGTSNRIGIQRQVRYYYEGGGRREGEEEEPMGRCDLCARNLDNLSERRESAGDGERGGGGGESDRSNWFVFIWLNCHAYFMAAPQKERERETQICIQDPRKRLQLYIARQGRRQRHQ